MTNELFNLEQRIVKELRALAQEAPTTIVSADGGPLTTDIIELLISRKYIALALPYLGGAYEPFSGGTGDGVTEGAYRSWVDDTLGILKNDPSYTLLFEDGGIQILFFPLEHTDVKNEDLSLATKVLDEALVCTGRSISLDAPCLTGAYYLCPADPEHHADGKLWGQIVEACKDGLPTNWEAKPHTCVTGGTGYINGAISCGTGSARTFDSAALGTYGLLIGPSGIGKTWSLLDIGLSVASDTDALDGLLDVPESAKVAGFFLEDSQWEISARTQAIGFRRGIGNVPFSTFGREYVAKSSVQEKRKAIEGYIDNVLAQGEGKLKLVIIDPYVEIINGSEINDADTKEANGWLMGLARTHNCHVLVGHHSSEASQKQFKGNGGALSQMAARGHSSIIGSSKWAINLSYAGHNKIAMQTSKVSYGEKMQKPEYFEMAYIEHGGKTIPAGFARRQGHKVEDKSTSTQEEKPLYQALPLGQEYGTKAEIVEMLKNKSGLSRDKARTEVGKMLESGALIEEKSGGKITYKLGS